MDKAVVMSERDNVATCLADLAAGETVEVQIGGGRQSVNLAEDIPFGHKVALADIGAGAEIIKYGETIGVASAPIAAGRRVHVHNIESVRARGDRP